ncbi:DUF4880 domain-containing protein, partial [Phenylobacterium sp.]|uniref:DUF4880 domain-containing protein n=1 Tax=Phenylobacterium sp. TaxID=1871053 RepID=UPI002FCBC1D3
MVFAGPGPDERRLAEAAAWRVRLAEADQESSEDFEAWLAADDANLAAWAAVEGGWREIGEAAAAPEMLALRRDALDRARRHARSRWRGPVLSRR